MLARNAIARSKEDCIFDLVSHTFLFIILAIILYPLIYIISASLSSPNAVTAGKVWLLPVDFSLQGYKTIFSNRQVMRGYANSIFYTVVGTCINIVVTLICAYPLSRKNLKGKGILMFIFTFTMLFSGGLIPTYLVVKDLHLIDSRLALLLPNALSIWNMIITRTFLATTIPAELYDSAEIDGSGDIRTFISIVIPVSGAIVAVNVLFYAVSHWNGYFDALLYLKNADLFPLQIILRNILILNSADLSMVADAEELALREGLKELLKYSLIVVASLPVMLIYPFVQKYFIKGIMIGSVKG